MIKSDKTKHNISIASIKRSTIKPYDFKWTKFYESNLEFFYSGFKLDLLENELIICSTVIDSNNYSVLTTRKLVTNENNIIIEGSIEGALVTSYGSFKGYGKEQFTFGTVQLKNGTSLKYFIETGKASMVMINGVKTLIQIQ